jgi:hypothetical protein
MKSAVAMSLMAALVNAPAARADEAAQPQQDSYDRRYIGFDDLAALDPKSGAVYRLTLPYEGKYKNPIAPVDFYRKVGREDLAQEYERRQSLRTALLVGGGAIALAAVIGSVIVASGSGPACSLGSVDFAQCVSESASSGRDRLTTASAIGLAGIFLGGSLTLAGAFTNPQPVSAPQMRELADRYNQKLRQSLSVAPVLAPGGAGVAMALRF